MRSKQKSFGIPSGNALQHGIHPSFLGNLFLQKVQLFLDGHGVILKVLLS
jgi:hypothetical protein